MTGLLELSANGAAAAVAAGDLDGTELFAFYRERAAADTLNAFTWVAEEVPAAGRPDAALGGVPLAVKDLFCTEGVPSQAGSRILEGYRPPYTATVVQALIEAGAPLLGKTNQDEFAMGSSNENSAFGPVLNPWSEDRVPGAPPGAVPRPWQPAWLPGLWAPTRGGRSVNRRPCAGSWASSPPTARCRAMA